MRHTGASDESPSESVGAPTPARPPVAATSNLPPKTSRLLPHTCAFLFREAFLLSLTLTLHLGVAATIAWASLAPRPAAPKPEVIAESLVLTLAETESPVPTEAATPPPRAQAAPPHPETAPFLFDDASPVALTAPDAFPAPAPAVPKSAPPPLPHRAPPSDLPEITLPPAQALPAPTPRVAAGATARLERPRLTSDPSHWLKHYPAEARRNHWEGTVVVRLEIAADGTLLDATLHCSSGHDVLDRAALRMLRTARFEGGPGILLQPITYKLR